MNYYCPECGKKMIMKVLSNETPFMKSSDFSTLVCEQIGDAYKIATGEKLYRLEFDCPTMKEKKRLFCNNELVSHYGVYSKCNLTEKEVEEIKNKNN